MEDGTPFGRYRLQSLLGRGGMGEVWRAFDTVTERVVALKLLSTQYADDATFQERFRREAKAAAGIDEPHVVPIYDFGEIDGRLFVTMRLIHGRDLHAILSDGPMDPARAVGIVDQIASALDAAHRVNLIHRDVKPSNILVGNDDFAYLIDFGIARILGQAGLTGTSNVIGTWAYMAPERITAGQTDARADIYALACVLYECLAGGPPFGRDSMEQQIGGHMSLPPPRVSRPGVPVALDAVIAEGMAKNPDERYATTRELARAARATLGESPTGPNTVVARTVSFQPPVPPGPTPPDRKPSRKGRVIALSSIGAAAVVAAVVAGLVLFNSGEHGASSSGTSPTAALANTGPLTGTFTAAMGPKTKPNGKPVIGDTDEAAFSEPWRLRSACGANGCVATASTAGQYPVKDLVFDKVGDGWLAVATSRKTCGVREDDEAWNVIRLAPQADGTLAGEATQITANGCNNTRTITLTRTADAEIAQLPDPAKLPARVVSPAEGFRGSYDMQAAYADGTKSPNERFAVHTDCMHTGDRCVSLLYNPKTDGRQVYVYASGTFTRNQEFDNKCPYGGTFHDTHTGTLALPQPPQNPIPVLTGHGYTEAGPGTKCHGEAYDETATRAGE